MYVLVKDKTVVKYPYSIGELKQDNPQTSFPATIPDSVLAEYGVHPVIPADRPEIDHTKNVVEEVPNLIKGQWYQDFKVVDATPEEIEQRIADMSAMAEKQRQEAYRNESDPLFFKWQRGEATEQEWLDKIQEIKERY